MSGIKHSASQLKDPECRHTARHAVIKGAKLSFGDTLIDCVVIDMSSTGLRVRTGVPMTVPNVLTVRLNGGAVFQARRCWAHGEEIGLEILGAVAVRGERPEIAWQAYEMVRAVTLGAPIRLLETERFFDDVQLQESARRAEDEIRKLEMVLLSHARRGG